MTNEEKYLKLLDIQKNPPSVTLLAAFIKRHLLKIPYENISKIIRFHNTGPSIPNLEEFVSGISEKTYGGTCFSQNIYLNHILNYIGFKSELVGICKDGILSHLSLRVNIEGSNYFVDVGIMSSFSGPFRIHPSESFSQDLGNQRFVFSPKPDLENYSLEIWRNGKIIRKFESSSLTFTEQDLEVGIQKTFEKSAMFMTTLCVHRVFDTHSLGVWNNSFYKINGVEHTVRQIQNYSELKSVFNNELMIPQYPLELTLNLLHDNGAPKLFEV
ncbi:MAG: arylamine N-acetyltransferase [Bdellovibrionaceae bacterium]|nr:arylamine N-acetyltransferase [Pseudobdellovibrionaceae bacterium]